MLIEKNKSLLAYNTFHIDAVANYFASFSDVESLKEILASPTAKSHAMYILGGGSNVLLTGNLHGLVMHNEMKGIEIVSEAQDTVRVKFMGGENWHETVRWCVDRNYGGIENLSLIPGTVGAAPIQNIGAYGVEFKDVFVELEALDLHTGSVHIIPKKACAFDYRSSIFKTVAKGQYVILSVTMQFSLQPVCNTSYGNIKEELDTMGITEPDIRSVSDAVIRIRRSKLPDPAVIGNAGSFFKNPVVSQDHFQQLKTTYPDIPSFPQEQGVKIPAAWLIEHTHPANADSWKGYREKNYGVHERQALCLVNYDKAGGKEIFELSARIITSVQHAFNITLEREVNVW